ncbi:Rok-like winged helix domain-containing protein [Bacillus chungangensis]|uniref:Repressor of ComK n=1 Tax=Bacillus chungangensis TaxID=587633 RepID=A0ABT9WVZ1_9BACI|nr:competence protein ComK [Bacillus chungangensis]MDQ0177478.1 hypothetical protein [Bacillus chungangensis]
MFDERAALQMRIEQLREAEERLLKELRAERITIYERLRELDDKEPKGAMNKAAEINQKVLEEMPQTPQANIENETNAFQAMNVEEPQETTIKKIRRSRPSRRSKSSKMREVAVAILKEQSEPMRGIVLKKEIEHRTGLTIPNMTSFMKTVENLYDHIKKPARGLYMYDGS